MHQREAQNVIVQRAVAQAAIALPTIERIQRAARQTTPVATSPGNVLRCGVQKIGEAVLGGDRMYPCPDNRQDLTPGPSPW